MIQPGFFDLKKGLHKIDKNSDPIGKINETVGWEIFRPALEKARDKNRQSNVRPKGYDVILLFKIPLSKTGQDKAGVGQNMIKMGLVQKWLTANQR
ncbi:MAG: hypothetical protein PHI97_25410 [Desulfobulbus sp.]|nr:hypothetical protein [Desulfobulbus sp.]